MKSHIEVLEEVQDMLGLYLEQMGPEAHEVPRRAYRAITAHMTDVRHDNEAFVPPF